MYAFPPWIITTFFFFFSWKEWTCSFALCLSIHRLQRFDQRFFFSPEKVTADTGEKKTSKQAKNFFSLTQTVWTESLWVWLGLKTLWNKQLRVIATTESCQSVSGISFLEVTSSVLWSFHYSRLKATAVSRVKQYHKRFTGAVSDKGERSTLKIPLSFTEIAGA